jgi:hypothetical protein
MKDKDTGGPAFPCDVFDGKKHTTSTGMTLRDYSTKFLIIMSAVNSSLALFASDWYAAIGWASAAVAWLAFGLTEK